MSAAGKGYGEKNKHFFRQGASEVLQGSIHVSLHSPYGDSQLLCNLLIGHILYIAETEDLAAFRRQAVDSIFNSFPQITAEKVAQSRIRVNIRYGMKHKVDLAVIPFPVGL